MSVFTFSQPGMSPPPRYASTRIQPPPYRATVKSNTLALNIESLSTTSISSSIQTSTSRSAPQLSPFQQAIHEPIPQAPTIPPPIYTQHPSTPRLHRLETSRFTAEELEFSTSQPSSLMTGQDTDLHDASKTPAAVRVVELRDEMDLREERAKQRREEDGRAGGIEGEEEDGEELWEQRWWCCCLPVYPLTDYERRHATQLTGLYFF